MLECVVLSTTRFKCDSFSMTETFAVVVDPIVVAAFVVGLNVEVKTVDGSAVDEGFEFPSDSFSLIWCLSVATSVVKLVVLFVEVKLPE